MQMETRMYQMGRTDDASLRVEILRITNGDVEAAERAYAWVRGPKPEATLEDLDAKVTRLLVQSFAKTADHRRWFWV